MTLATSWASSVDAEPLVGTPIVFEYIEALPEYVTGLLKRVDPDSKQVPELDPLCLVIDPTGAIATARRVGEAGSVDGILLEGIGPRNFGMDLQDGWVEGVRTRGYALLCGYRDPFLASHLAHAPGAHPVQWRRLSATECLGVVRAFSVSREIDPT